jgi:hypothetical protein
MTGRNNHADQFRAAAVVRAALVAFVLAAGMVATAAWACPFCTVESQTLSEELNTVDGAVLAKLVKEAAPIELGSDGIRAYGSAGTITGDATFEIVDVLRGKELLGDTKQIEVTYFGPPDREQVFLITGIGSDPIGWTTPLPMSAAAVEYVHQLEGLAPSGADRLAFFQDYLEHDDPLLAQDAYDEFARAPYQELHDLADRMRRDQLLAWIANPEISPSGRRLYLTMLGICGTAEDLPVLEEMIVSDYAVKRPLVEGLVEIGLGMGGPVGLIAWPEVVQLEERREKLGLDALVACYLTLRGPEGLDLIDERFLEDPKVEYTYIYSTIMALRFHGESTDVLPHERLLASMRLLLDNPDFADQVIPDLARWEDWSVLDRLVEMFRTAGERTYVRQPIVTYLTVASEQAGPVSERATVALEELEALDPEAVQQARNLSAFGFLARARATATGAGATRPTAEEVLADDTTTADGIADSEFPDPADYQMEDSPSGGDRTVAAVAVDATPSADGDAEVPAAPPASPLSTADEKPLAEDGVLDFGAKSVAEDQPTAASPPVAVNRSLSAGDFLPPSRWWIVGVPLVVATALMGLYWLILRSGPV